eukprot:Nitzschia sp. Nitz4//scaffold32_size149145//45702//47345//NITZ4_002872-RA/size149145-processed-gene-0.90-mRNA-1//1//CDS//3329548048//2491//frame0
MGNDENEEKFRREHPRGNSLLARDNKENRKLFPDGPFGSVDIAESICPDGNCPFYHYQEDATPETSIDTPIHMLVAAFRDKLCARTIHNAFSRAKNPKRVFIRIIDQTQPHSDLVDDQGCWPRYCNEYNENCEEFAHQVRAVRVDSANSKGPTWARSKLSAMALWDYEHRDDPSEIDLTPIHLQDFCMQIDSHMDFSDDYDQGLIAMHHRTKNDYAVLSTYVADIDQNNQDPIVVPNLCMVTFTSSIRNWGTKECRGLVTPKLTNAMWGAGLSFHRCHAEVNVPVDPYLDEVFDGEEGSRGIRFFTHGYDVYTPDKVLVTHDYHGHQSNPIVHTWGRGKRGKKQNEATPDQEEVVMEDHWKWMEDIDAARDQWHTFGSKRVNMLLSIGSTFNATQREAEEVEQIRRSRYGLGNKRTLEQARDFTGINLLEEKMEINKCGNLLWVPYQESPNYGIDDFLARAHGVSTLVAQPGAKVGAALPKMLRASAGGAAAVDQASSIGQVSGVGNQTSPEAGAYSGTLVFAILVFAIVGVMVMGKLRQKDRRHKD